MKALASSKIIKTNNPNKKQTYSNKNAARFKAIRIAQLYKENTLSSQDGTTDNSSPTPDRMWNFRMAQYTMTVYTSTHSPALGPFKSIIETKNTETGNINLLPVSKQFALHNCTKGTSCQAKTEALIIHHPHLTACGTFTWLSTR